MYLQGSIAKMTRTWIATFRVHFSENVPLHQDSLTFWKTPLTETFRASLRMLSSWAATQSRSVGYPPPTDSTTPPPFSPDKHNRSASILSRIYTRHWKIVLDIIIIIIIIVAIVRGQSGKANADKEVLLLRLTEFKLASWWLAFRRERAKNVRVIIIP